jgi:hypothetical protein
MVAPISSTMKSTAIDISMGAIEYNGDSFVFFKGSDGSLWVYTELPFLDGQILELPPQKGVKLGTSMGA